MKHFFHTLHTKFVLLNYIYDYIAILKYALLISFKQIFNIEKGKCFIIAVKDAVKVVSFLTKND